MLLLELESRSLALNMEGMPGYIDSMRIKRNHFGDTEEKLIKLMRGSSIDIFPQGAFGKIRTIFVKVNGFFSQVHCIGKMQIGAKNIFISIKPWL